MRKPAKWWHMTEACIVSDRPAKSVRQLEEEALASFNNICRLGSDEHELDDNRQSTVAVA
jgi:hypothetical protein